MVIRPHNEELYKFIITLSVVELSHLKTVLKMEQANPWQRLTIEQIDKALEDFAAYRDKKW